MGNRNDDFVSDSFDEINEIDDEIVEIDDIDNDIDDDDDDDDEDEDEDEGPEDEDGKPTRGRSKGKDFPLETAVDSQGNSLFGKKKKLIGVPVNDLSEFKVLKPGHFENKGHFYEYEADRLESLIAEKKDLIAIYREDGPYYIRGETPPREEERKAVAKVTKDVDYLSKIAQEAGQTDTVASLAKIREDLLKDVLGS